MDAQRYLDLLAKFAGLKVMVVGDIYLDENIFGVVTGISLEAPIPIFEVAEKRHNPGAAGNAACNVASLGATTYMIGYVGADANADVVKREFALRNVDTSYVVTHPGRATNTYGKLRAGTFNAPSQEVLRTDTPKATFISGAVEDAIIANIKKLAPQVDAIAVVDQVSSVVTERVLETIAAVAAEHKILTVGDSRERAGAFKHFDIIVPNDREAGIGAGIEVVDDGSCIAAGKALTKVCKNALVTRGPKGITVFAADGSIADVPIANPITAVDVTGAGDTVTAAVTLSVAAGGTLVDAAVIGNAAAGIAVVQSGVVTVSNAEVAAAFVRGSSPAKLKTVEELTGIIRNLQEAGNKVVWTNGCFDIIHIGHITYLQRSRQAGDVLVIGINSDQSVRELKGPDRPIIGERERAIVLAALECVDYVTIFEDKSPLRVIDALKPDVYAKGGDYTIDTVDQDERRLVEGYGGAIHIVPGVDDKSTTSIVQRIRG